jgi:hypothetical protein
MILLLRLVHQPGVASAYMPCDLQQSCQVLPAVSQEHAKVMAH